ncbi:MAG: GFA family protein, partial [Steroidobacteraceae bacterium]
TRAWLVGIGADDFRLLKGQDALSDYQFGRMNIHHLFCKHCGVKSFGRAAGPDGKPFVAIVLSTVDNISDDDLATMPVMYIDGRNDDFAAAPAETRYL